MALCLLCAPRLNAGCASPGWTPLCSFRRIHHRRDLGDGRRLQHCLLLKPAVRPHPSGAAVAPGFPSLLENGPWNLQLSMQTISISSYKQVSLNSIRKTKNAIHLFFPSRSPNQSENIEPNTETLFYNRRISAAEEASSSHIKTSGALNSSKNDPDSVRLRQ